MALIRTYLDANIPIEGFRSGSPEKLARARAIIASPRRLFITSPFLRLELLPVPERTRNRDQLTALRVFFRDSEPVTDLDRVFTVAHDLVRDHQLSVMDALHVASAHVGRCDELITREGKATKPIYRQQLVPVTYFEDAEP